MSLLNRSYRGAFFVAIASLLLAGCASNGAVNPGGVSAPSSRTPAAHANPFAIKAFFPKTPTGARYPNGNLVEVGGKLYGIADGGLSATEGTIFSVSGNDLQTVYRFSSTSNDGNGPNGDIIVVKTGGDAKIYGTTQFGGGKNHGTIFSYDPKTDKESIVYSFQGNADGGGPGAGVIEVDGALYGTTRHGGENGRGGLFKFALPNGKVGLPVILHQFDKMPDASDVEAPLLYKNGSLFGVSKEGGEYKGPRGSFADGYGSIFKFGLDGNGGVCGSANGKDLIIPDHPFVNNGDQFLVNVGQSDDNPDGFIYSMGENGCNWGPLRNGSIPKAVGSGPSGGLLASGAFLYGVLFYGGSADAGVLYRYVGRAQAGAPFEVLHAFAGKPGEGSLDGCHPVSTPILVGTTIYGTTRRCGKDDLGTVWAW